VAVDPSVAHSRCDNWLVALVEPVERNCCDRHDEQCGRRLERDDAHSIASSRVTIGGYGNG
jgi:hypothetical protein